MCIIGRMAPLPRYPKINLIKNKKKKYIKMNNIMPIYLRKIINQQVARVLYGWMIIPVDINHFIDTHCFLVDTAAGRAIYSLLPCQ